MINDKEKEQVDIISAVLNRLSMQFNPGFIGGGSPTVTYNNSEFERHHRSAQETGLPDVSPEMQAAINAIYKNKDSSIKVTQVDLNELG